MAHTEFVPHSTERDLISKKGECCYGRLDASIEQRKQHVSCPLKWAAAAHCDFGAGSETSEMARVEGMLHKT